MSPAERRSRLVALLARIDQLVAECEELLAEVELEPAEALSVADHLQYHRKAREQVEMLLSRE
jgi:hypothetical protein